MKVIGYFIFACFFYIFRLFPIKKHKVFCIMTHDSSSEGNVGMVMDYLKGTSAPYIFYTLSRSQRDSVKGQSANRLNSLIDFFIKKPYQLATSAYVLQDNIFLPLAYIRFSKKVKVIQLWHGTGNIKRFGQDVNTGKLKRLEYKANRTITHLIINSVQMRNQYARAFGISPNKILAYGLPRTDLLFDPEARQQMKNDFFEELPELKDKILLLYAPTFRDSQVENPTIAIEMEKLLGALPEECVLLLKLHPHVAENFSLNPDISHKFVDRIFDFSRLWQLNALMEVSTLLISDYSSLVYEYSLQEKPMIFYAYDLENFLKNGRGFYEPYETFVPGVIATTTESLLRGIQNILTDPTEGIKRARDFKLNYFDYFDGGSTKRVASLFQP